MKQREFVIALTGLALVAAAGSVVSAPKTTVKSLGSLQTAAPARSPGGHPRAFPGMFDSIPMVQPPMPAGASVPIPVLSPLVQGSYINFDSPPVRPIALSEDGLRLYATNTPAGTLDIFNAGNGQLSLAATVQTGLEPVAAAVQPGSQGRYVWVANMISDDVVVVDTATNAVVSVIEVGDEPCNVLFDSAGQHAYVVLQGPPRSAIVAGDVDTRGALLVIDTSSKQIVGTVRLECNVPRAATLLPNGTMIAVAAQRSGNNTTTIGRRVDLLKAKEWAVDIATTTIGLAKMFSVTSSIANASAAFGDWPGPSPLPGVPEALRIIKRDDADWAAIVDAVSGDDGQVDPDVAERLAEEFGSTIESATAALHTMITEITPVSDNDVLIVDVGQPSAPAVTSIIGGVGTTLNSIVAAPNTSVLVLTNMEARNTVRTVQNLRGHIVDHEVVFVDVATVPPQIAHYNVHSPIPGFDDVSAPNLGAQALALANPIDLIYNGAGNRVFMAALGSDRVGMVNSQNGSSQVLNVGRGPRALALDEEHGYLYTFNRTDLSISVVDISGDSASVVSTQYLFTPELATAIEGRHLMNSTKFSNNFGSSCAVCHIDGDKDDLAWDLSDSAGDHLLPAPQNLPGVGNHPVKGPMVTQSLSGLAGHEHFHWRGDKPTFSDFNEAFEGLLGGSQIPAEDMLTFSEFALSREYPPNPFMDRDHSFHSPLALEGGAFYLLNCNACHNLTHDGTLRLEGHSSDAGLNFGTLAASLQIEEIAQIRGLFKKINAEKFTGAGLLHDGRERSANEPSAFQQFVADFFPPSYDKMGNLIIGVPPAGRPKIDAFVRSFPTNVTSVVGWQIRTAGPLTPAQSADVSLMVSQRNAAPSRCDVVCRGDLGDGLGFRGWVLASDASGASIMRDDRGGSLSLSALLAAARHGSLIFMAVPPGSGERLGVDADADCILNGLDPNPYSSPDFDRSGRIQESDATAFAEALLGSDPRTDYNHDGVSDASDLDAFLVEWERSCR